MPEDALTLYNSSRFDEAIAAMRARLGSPLPRDEASQSLATLADIHIMLRQWQQAAEAYAASVNLGGPEVGARLCTLTSLLIQLGDHGQALNICDFLATATGSPEHLADNQIRRARALLGLDRRDEARAAIDFALEIDAGHRLATLWRRLLSPAKPGGVRVVDMMSQPAQCRALLDAAEWYWHPTWVPSEFLTAISPYLNRHTFEDLRFVVTDQQGRPLLRGDIHAGFGGVRGFGGPMWLRPAVAIPEWSAAATAAIEHVAALERAFGGGGVIAELPDAEGRVSPLGLACLKQGGRTDMTMVMDLDLTRPEAELWAKVRKSYRPLITAGDKRFHLRMLTRDNPDWSLYDCYRVLHYQHFPARIADLMFTARPAMERLVAEGRLELLVGFDGDRPVSATMIIDEDGVGQYYSARYVRDAGIDVGPWAVWGAVRRCRQRGLRRFHLGYHDFEECQDDKMRRIAFFKAGFAESWHYLPLWRLPAAT